MQVDLPLPEAPMMATNSPRSTEKVTPFSASNCWSPMVKTRRISVRVMTSLMVSERAPHAATHGTGLLLGIAAGLFDDHLITLLQLPFHQLDAGTAGNAGLHRHGHRLAIPQDVDLLAAATLAATGSAATRRSCAGRALLRPGVTLLLRHLRFEAECRWG